MAIIVSVLYILIFSRIPVLGKLLFELTALIKSLLYECFFDHYFSFLPKHRTPKHTLALQLLCPKHA